MHGVSEFDFVFEQSPLFPIGLTKSSPAEFKRRVLAGGASYALQLSSMDYTNEKYIDSEMFENERENLGDKISDFIKIISENLKQSSVEFHHHEGEHFGRIGAEITLFKIWDILNTARQMANKGYFLEVLPILRLALEMASWSLSVHPIRDPDEVISVKSTKSIGRLKVIYPTSGHIYGYLTKFSHWEHQIHTHFIKNEENRVAIPIVSCVQRAKSLALCVLLLDVIVEVHKSVFGKDFNTILDHAKSFTTGPKQKLTIFWINEISQFAVIEEIDQIERLFSQISDKST